MLPERSEPGSHRIYQELAIVKQMHDAYVREEGGASGDASGSGVRRPPSLSGR